MKADREDIAIISDGMEDETDDINELDRQEDSMQDFMDELGIGPNESDDEIQDHDWFVRNGIIDEG